MTAHDFITAISKALADSAKHGFSPRRELETFAALPADWALRLKNQQCGLIVRQLGSGVLVVTSPCQQWRLTLVVEPNQDGNLPGVAPRSTAH